MISKMITYKNERLTYDKLTSRSYDTNGFLHVSGCNISKNQISPYNGYEIPEWEQLALESNRVYYILRPADELAKAASTFNNLPLMDVHIPLSSFNLENTNIKAHQIGATGSLCRFEEPYLVNDLVIFTAGAIAAIQTEEQKEISCAYAYDIVLESGEFNGVHYDGRMTNIKGNHVAIVPEGRAGHDVCVADNKPDNLKIAKKIADLLYPICSISETINTSDKIKNMLTPLITSDTIIHELGENGPWSIRSEKTGKKIWSGKSKEEAKKALKRMAMFKHTK